MSIQSQQSYESLSSYLGCGCASQSSIKMSVLIFNLTEALWPLKLLKMSYVPISAPQHLEMGKTKTAEVVLSEQKWQDFDDSLFEHTSEPNQEPEGLQKSFESEYLPGYDSETEDYFNEIWSKLNSQHEKV